MSSCEAQLFQPAQVWSLVGSLKPLAIHLQGTQGMFSHLPECLQRERKAFLGSMVTRSTNHTPHSYGRRSAKGLREPFCPWYGTYIGA